MESHVFVNVFKYFQGFFFSLTYRKFRSFIS